MPADFLEKIILSIQKQNELRRAFRENIRKHLDASEYPRYSLFRKCISVPGRINLIAEIKKASPSRGLIRDDFNPQELASIYEQNGAAAISVLTEEKYFLGKPEYLGLVAGKTRLPLLMKDFVIDELQVYEGRYLGASAVLLILAVLPDQRVKELTACAHRLDLDVLVEVHNEEELRRAIDLGAGIIGINNRDLHTFRVDVANSERMIPLVPADRVVVAESGISSYAEILRLKQAGAHAVLIGETFLKERDVARKIKDVMYGQGEDLRNHQ